MKTCILSSVLALLAGLLIGHLLWEHHRGDCSRNCRPGPADPKKEVVIKKTDFKIAKRDILEHRYSLSDPEDIKNMYGYYTEYEHIDAQFGPEGLFKNMIDTLDRPQQANGIGVYYARRGSEKFYYIVFSYIPVNGKPEDSKDHFYRIDGLEINLYRVYYHHHMHSTGDSLSAARKEKASAHRTCQGNCPDWYPKD